MKFKAKVKFIFEGDVEIDAPSKEEAQRSLNNDFGAVIGGIQGIGYIEDWNFPVHPEKRIVSLKQLKN